MIGEHGDELVLVLWLQKVFDGAIGQLGKRLIGRGEVEGLEEEGTPAEGLLFTSPVAYEVGAALELDCIEVAGVGRATVRGRVVRLESGADGGYEVGVACLVEGAEATLVRGESS